MNAQEAVVEHSEALASEHDDVSSAAGAQSIHPGEGEPSQISWEQTREQQLKEKHDKLYEHSELLLHRPRLSSDDLKVLVTFAERFGLMFYVEENLGKYAWSDGRHGLMISISDLAF